MSAKIVTAVPPAPTFADITTDEVEFGLFALKAGIPAKEALEQASARLEVVIDTIRSCPEVSSTDSEIWAAIYVCEQARALVNGVVNGACRSDHRAQG